jgi:hypothetical protein
MIGRVSGSRALRSYVITSPWKYKDNLVLGETGDGSIRVTGPGVYDGGRTEVGGLDPIEARGAERVRNVVVGLGAKFEITCCLPVASSEGFDARGIGVATRSC